ncbi:MAG: aldehyde dehydrogenase family protein, partial [Paracoccaceae bacterium]
MSGLNKNFIAGDWVAGSSEIENRNPSDLSDLIGLYAQASPDQLDTTLAQ